MDQSDKCSKLSLTLRGVSKAFGGVAAVWPLDLVISPGQTTVLIGPSGCGNSTILRLMIGLVRPDQGIVLFEGEEMKAANMLSLRRKMGYVIQDGGLFPHMTAKKNVILMAEFLKWPAEKILERMNRLTELAQFPKDALNRFPGQLSGGQKQRVSLMRALLLDPDVLLLDEPLGALDPMIRHDMQEELQALFKTLKKTVVLVTHDLAEADFFADHILLLRDGRIVQQGTLSQLVNSPEDTFVQKFVNAQRPGPSYAKGKHP